MLTYLFLFNHKRLSLHLFGPKSQSFDHFWSKKSSKIEKFSFFISTTLVDSKKLISWKYSSSTHSLESSQLVAKSVVVKLDMSYSMRLIQSELIKSKRLALFVNKLVVGIIRITSPWITKYFCILLIVNIKSAGFAVDS